ncbi:MAG: hypothetical protein ABJG68_00750 [Crocinitomicaceae bacterium]
MKNLMHQLGFGESFKIKAVVAVKELMNYDMIYVYHHLKENSVVELKLAGTNLMGEPEYHAYFKGFRLGTIFLSGIIRSFYEGQETLYAEVAGISKNKYFPINSLDLQLGVESLKKVG